MGGTLSFMKMYLPLDVEINEVMLVDCLGFKIVDKITYTC